MTDVWPLAALQYSDRQVTTLPASRAALGRAVVLLGGDVAALLHEAAPVVPEAVVEGQLVLQLLRLVFTGVRIVPLVRCQPGRTVRRAGCCSNRLFTRLESLDLSQKGF